MMAVVAVVVLIAGFVYFTSVDRTKPDAVATAFTKAYKAGNMSKASKYWLPADAAAWHGVGRPWLASVIITSTL